MFFIQQINHGKISPNKTLWSLLTEQMIGSMGWKSTSLTILRWPGKRYLYNHIRWTFLLNTQRSCIINIYKAITTSTRSHRQIRTPWTTKKITTCTLLTISSIQYNYSMTSHQFQTSTFTFKVWIDIPHTQSCIQGMTESIGNETPLWDTNSHHQEPNANPWLIRVIEGVWLME